MFNISLEFSIHVLVFWVWYYITDSSSDNAEFNIYRITQNSTACHNYYHLRHKFSFGHLVRFIGQKNYVGFQIFLRLVSLNTSLRIIRCAQGASQESFAARHSYFDTRPKNLLCGLVFQTTITYYVFYNNISYHLSHKSKKISFLPPCHHYFLIWENY